MKYLKKWKLFLEDVLSSSTTSGMGDISSSQPGTLPGTTGDVGSGDLGFTFKKEKREKGDPTEVTDMRDLENSKEVTHVKEIKESEMAVRDPNYDTLTSDMIDDCVVELFDEDFDLVTMNYDKHFNQEELIISLNKNVSQYWDGNITINCKFDENGIISQNVSTLRARGKSLDENEQNLFDLVEEVAQKLIISLDYQSGEFSIQWLSVNYNRRGSNNVSLNVGFTLNNNLKN